MSIIMHNTLSFSLHGEKMGRKRNLVCGINGKLCVLFSFSCSQSTTCLYEWKMFVAWKIILLAPLLLEGRSSGGGGRLYLRTNSFETSERERERERKR
jgi:hypothetical protein